MGRFRKRIQHERRKSWALFVPFFLQTCSKRAKILLHNLWLGKPFFEVDSEADHSFFLPYVVSHPHFSTQLKMTTSRSPTPTPTSVKHRSGPTSSSSSDSATSASTSENHPTTPHPVVLDREKTTLSLTILVNSDVNAAAFRFLDVHRFSPQGALSAFNILASGSQADRDVLARLVLAPYQIDPVAANSFVLEQYWLDVGSISASTYIPFQVKFFDSGVWCENKCLDQDYSNTFFLQIKIARASKTVTP